jgi:hypothetical protein
VSRLGSFLGFAGWKRSFLATFEKIAGLGGNVFRGADMG